MKSIGVREYVPSLSTSGRLATVVISTIVYWAFFHHLGDTGEQHLLTKHVSRQHDDVRIADTITPAELDVLQRQGNIPTRNGIPLLLHQGHGSHRGLREEQRAWIESWHKGHARDAGWRHVYWSTDDREALIARRLPWLLETYKAYPHKRHRANVARIAIMKEYGGVYANIDYECARDGCLAAAYASNCSVSLADGVGDGAGLFRNSLIVSRRGASARAADQFWDAAARLAQQDAEAAAHAARRRQAAGWWGAALGGSTLPSAATGSGLLTRTYKAVVRPPPGRGAGPGGEGPALPPRRDAGVCLLPDALLAGDAAPVVHHRDLWMQHAHRRTLYLPRVVPCLLALLAGVFCVTHRVIVVPASIVFCATAGFPANPADAIVGAAVVAPFLTLLRTPASREALKRFEFHFWCFFVTASLFMFVQFPG